MPVLANVEDLPVVSSRHKRDFGISLALAVAVTALAAAVTAAGVALATSIPTEQALNNLIVVWLRLFKHRKP